MTLRKLSFSWRKKRESGGKGKGYPDYGLVSGLPSADKKVFAATHFGSPSTGEGVKKGVLGGGAKTRPITISQADKNLGGGRKKKKKTANVAR